jgi:glycosyltransferase involved in cell wall biosynthesis
MQLIIVIPALNEENAIGGTIERCLPIKNQFPKELRIQDIRIVVVSDGSTGRTAEIAKTFSAVDVIVFYENRGYGAAIKAGWHQAGGDLLGFLDADGTCDPQYFIPMCRQIVENGKDIVLGCRMNEHSKMPWLRRLRNALFAALLGFLSQKKVRDTASGMRVIRRDVLPKLLPLPDGLHFTLSCSPLS